MKPEAQEEVYRLFGPLVAKGNALSLASWSDDDIWGLHGRRLVFWKFSEDRQTLTLKCDSAPSKHIRLAKYDNAVSWFEDVEHFYCVVGRPITRVQMIGGFHSYPYGSRWHVHYQSLCIYANSLSCCCVVIGTRTEVKPSEPEKESDSCRTP